MRNRARISKKTIIKMLCNNTRPILRSTSRKFIALREIAITSPTGGMKKKLRSIIFLSQRILDEEMIDFTSTLARDVRINKNGKIAERKLGHKEKKKTGNIVYNIASNARGSSAINVGKKNSLENKPIITKSSTDRNAQELKKTITSAIIVPRYSCAGRIGLESMKIRLSFLNCRINTARLRKILKKMRKRFIEPIPAKAAFWPRLLYPN